MFIVADLVSLSIFQRGTNLIRDSIETYITVIFQGGPDTLLPPPPPPPPYGSALAFSDIHSKQFGPRSGGISESFCEKVYFEIKLTTKKHVKLPSECEKVWIRIRPDILFVGA